MISTFYLFYQNLQAYSKRGRRKHAFLPESLKFTDQHINSSNERQQNNENKQNYEGILMRGMHLL